MVFSMYEPLANNDDDKICALLRIYRNYYLIIGGIIGIIGLILTPFIPKIIHGSVPNDINIIHLYLIYIISIVLSHWLCAYKSSILEIYQRRDIISKITLVIDTIQFILQFIALCLFKNYYIYVMIKLSSQIVINCVITLYVNKNYSIYKAKGEISKDTKINIHNRVISLFTAKVGMVLLNSIDTIIVSAFFGLNILAIYQNYYFIIVAVSGFISVLFSSSLAGIGNSIVIEKDEKNFRDFLIFTFIVFWITAVSSSCLINLIQPFMEVWMGKDLMLEINIVVCLVANFFVCEINALLEMYKDAGGIWNIDKLRPFVTSLFNLILSYIMAKQIGLIGVIEATLLTMIFISLPWLLYDLFTTIFKQNSFWIYLRKSVSYLIISIFAILITFVICKYIKGSVWISFFIKCVVSFTIPNIIFYLIYKHTEECSSITNLINKMFFKKS